MVMSLFGRGLKWPGYEFFIYFVLLKMISSIKYYEIISIKVF